MNSLEKTLEERGKNYGSFHSFSEISQGLKNFLKEKQCTASQKEALEMILHKVARIINGDPNYIDSWQDIAGYAQLIVNELEKER